MRLVREPLPEAAGCFGASALLDSGASRLLIFSFAFSLEATFDRL